MTERLLPMLATPSTGASGRHPVLLEDLVKRGWIQDTKLDGVRSFGRHGSLINREGVDITYRYPEVTVPDDLWLDGEIVAVDGKFETTLLRDQQSKAARIKILAERHPCRFVAFDLLGTSAGEIDNLSYADRRARLETAAQHREFPITPISTDLDFFDQVAALGMEGVIAKQPMARYQFGKRSKDWVKFKVLFRITAIAVGYLPGQGQRADFGSMRLALVGSDGQVAEVGRVGSGFTERDIRMLKERLDAGQFFPVEIECTARTKDNALRFPVYKGIRTDVPITDCTWDQVEALPTC